MKHSLAAVVVTGSIIGVAVCASLQAAVPVTWDGSSGPSIAFHAPDGYWRWEESNWTKNAISGQTASATMGDSTGGRGGVDIVIGGGAKVFHDQNDSATDPGALGDFKPRMDINGPGSLTIKEGSILWLDGHTDIDGRWARMDINVNIDNGTLKTASTDAFCPPSECSLAAGRIILGYNNDLLANTILQWNITNGGRIEMEGKMTWGNPNFWEEDDPETVPVEGDNPQTGHNRGIGVAMTINDGTLDLTGGNLYDDFFGLVNGELIFFYERVGPNTVGAPLGPKNEQYSINFTGPGQIIVDNGIFIAQQDAEGTFLPHEDLDPGAVPDLYTSATYQDLWNLGILKANGVTGAGGAFGTYFSVSGSPGSPNYTLTSLVAPPGLDGDHNGDGVVNNADYVAWRKNPAGYGGATGYSEWRTNFGEPGGAGGGGGVPEPGSLIPLMIGVAGLWYGRRSFVGRC